MKISHILVATDLSAEATSCIPTVADLARSVGARITLLHVMESFDAIPHGSPLAPPLRLPEDMKTVEGVRAQMEERLKLFGPGIPMELELVTGGDPAEEITKWAQGRAVDLVAVTTHGRTGLRRLAMGSVAEGIIRHSRIPVLVLPLPKI